jgi:hypothetical protein
MRQDDSGIGQEAAPVARMMRALAQIDDEVDQIAAAGAEEERRLAGSDPGAIRCDQQICLQELISMLQAQLAQSRRADFLAHLDQDLGVEAEPTSLCEHRSQRRDVDAVLPLVVGGAAPVDASAFDRCDPGRESGSPLIVETADRVPVAVDQHRHQIGILDALRNEKGRARRVVENVRDKSKRGQARRHLIHEIFVQCVGAFRLLAGARDRDAPPEIDQEFAAVEVIVRASNAGGASHGVTPTISAAARPRACAGPSG